MKANTTSIPARADTNVLLKHRVGNEPLVILCIPDVGNTSPFDLRGRDGKTLVLQWASKHNGHIVKIPASLWHQNGNAMAINILDQRRSNHTYIVTFDEYQSPEKMGAVAAKPVDTVVGSIVADSAAPASVTANSVINKPAEVVVDLGADEAMPLHAIVATYIQRNGSSRMKQVESDLEVPASEIRASLELPDSPVELSGGWVKFKG